MKVIPSGMVTSPKEYAKRSISAGKQEVCTGLNQYSSGGLHRMQVQGSLILGGVKQTNCMIVNLWFNILLASHQLSA